MSPISGTYSFRLQWIRTCLLPHHLFASRLTPNQLSHLNQFEQCIANSESFELPSALGHALLRLWTQQLSNNNSNNQNMSFSNAETATNTDLLRFINNN